MCYNKFGAATTVGGQPSGFCNRGTVTLCLDRNHANGICTEGCDADVIRTMHRPFGRSHCECSSWLHTWQGYTQKAEMTA